MKLLISLLFLLLISYSHAQVSILINGKAVSAGQVVDFNTIQSVAMKYGSTTKAPPKSTYGNLIYRIRIHKPGEQDYFYTYPNLTYGFEVISATFKEKMNKNLSVRYNETDKDYFLREKENYTEMVYNLKTIKQSYLSEKVELEAQIVFQEKLGYEKFSDDIILAKSPRVTIQLYKKDGRIRFGELPFSVDEATLVKELGTFPTFAFHNNQLKENDLKFQSANEVSESNRLMMQSGGEWYMGQFSYPGTNSTVIKDSMIAQITNYLGYKSNASNGKKFKGSYTSYDPFPYYWYTGLPRQYGAKIMQMDLKSETYDANYQPVNYSKVGDYHCLVLSYDIYTNFGTYEYDGSMTTILLISEKNPGTVYFIRSRKDKGMEKLNHSDIISKWKSILSTIQ